jgi:hypothetical protein
MATTNSTVPPERQSRSLRLVPKVQQTAAAPVCSEVYSRMREDGTLEFGLRGCDSADAVHHLMALSKLIGSLSEIVDARGDDPVERCGRLVLFDGPKQ